jgi:hypothetical protein
MKNFGQFVNAVLIVGAANVQAAVWVTPIPGGEIRFDDWGFTGPNGRTAVDFEPTNGFGNNPLDPTGGISQIQHVITKDPDGLTPDAPFDLLADLIQVPGTGATPVYPDANMDATVNFYGWGYTTVGGSKFDDMLIDYDGDYFIAREDMNFNYYGVLHYTNMGESGPTADGVYDTNIGFQPYALSDAKGWCGSVLASHPLAAEPMAGQVTFDFGFEAFFPWSPPGQVPGTGSMQIVKDFAMRSYGTLEIETTAALGAAGDFLFVANAVVNNTNPAATITGNFNDLVSESDYYNDVSFMGGGVVRPYVWVLVQDSAAAMTNTNIIAVLDEDELGDPLVPVDPATGQPMQGDLVHHQNSFAGYPFLLRADGVRIPDYYDEAFFTDTSNVPPSISGFWQSTASYGNLVFVFGDAFVDGETQVAVNGVPVPLVEVLNNNLLIFMLPAGDTNGPITVSTAAGSSTSATDYEAIPSTDLSINGFWPAHASPGDTVFVFGAGFDTVPGSTEVRLDGGAPVPLVHVADEKMLLFRVPTDATTGPITVTSSIGSVSSERRFVRYP